MRTFLLPVSLLLPFSFTTARSFSTGRPVSHFHVLSLASPAENNGENQLRAATLLTSTIETAADSTEENEEKNGTIKTKLKGLFNNVKTAPFALAIAAFLLGYRLGGKATAAGRAAATATPRAAARQYPVMATLLLMIAIRDTWSLIPNWVKKNVPIIGRSAREAEEADPDDLTSFATLSSKLRSLYQRGKEKLSTTGSDEIVGSPTLVLIALFQTMSHIKQRVAHGRDQMYEESGQEMDNPRDVLDQMDDWFEYADWAYDELPEGQTIRGNLQAKGYTLLRHEKIVLPGHVAHYVAVDPVRKQALIGVKGTSGLEDMLTDCCGNAVRYRFQNDYVPEGSLREISCHEGILLSSRRLADDLLTFVESVLLPAGYKITITGHSLGAGVAAISAMILRSKIPQLQRDNKLKVLAFASPPILDYQAAKSCESFVTTFINNSDIIPRCSLSNLVLLLEFMKTVNKHLDEEGMRPRDMRSTAAFAKWLSQGKHGDMLLEPPEIQAAMDRALGSLDIDDPDHLYVPGRVVHLWDQWTKANYGNKSDYENVPKDFDESQKVPTAEKVYVADGVTKPLRIIELDDRMLSDHMSAGYRASIRSLLDKADQLFPNKPVTTTTTTQ